jgi:ISXO2-like transposase domain
MAANDVAGLVTAFGGFLDALQLVMPRRYHMAGCNRKTPSLSGSRPWGKRSTSCIRSDSSSMQFERSVSRRARVAPCGVLPRRPPGHCGASVVAAPIAVATCRTAACRSSPALALRRHRPTGCRTRTPAELEARWRGITGSFHKVSRKYLPLYVAEFEFRYNNRNNPDIFGAAIGRC